MQSLIRRSARPMQSGIAPPARRAVATVLLLIAGIACSGIGVAEEAPVPSLDSVRVEQQKLQSALQANDPAWARLDADTRQQVLTAQARLLQLIGEHHDIAELRPNDQLRVYNQLQRIKVLLARGDQDVCEQTALAGTHRQQIACMSRDERDRRAKGARDTLMTRPACTTYECQVGGGSR